MEEAEVQKIAQNRLQFDIAVEILRNMENDINAASIEKKIRQVYAFCAWEFLEKKDKPSLLKARECLMHLNFDPEEIIDLKLPNFNLNTNFQVTTAEDRDMEFVNFLLKHKRNQLLEMVENNVTVIPADKIDKKSNSKQALEMSAQPIQWLQLIDYCLIRIYLQQQDFKILFDFLNSGQIYCTNKKQNLDEVILTLQSSQQRKEKIYVTPIIALLCIIKGDQQEALKCLQKVIQLESKSFNFQKFSQTKTITIFESIRKQNNFKEMLEKNFSWLCEYPDLLKEIFLLIDQKIISRKDFLKLFDGLNVPNKFDLKESFLKSIKAQNQQADSGDINNAYAEVLIQQIDEKNMLEKLKILLDFLKNPNNPINAEQINVSFEVYFHKVYEKVKHLDIIKDIIPYYLRISSLLQKRRDYDPDMKNQ